MARYKVTMPDGSVYRVEAPEGATEAEIYDYAKRGSVGGGSVMDKPDDEQRARFMRAVIPGISGGQLAPDILKGVLDIPTGVAQLVSRGIEAVTPSGGVVGNAATALREGVDRQQARQDDFYKTMTRPDKQFGSSVGRGVGQALVTAPAIAVAPAAALGGRMMQGAGLGGLTAALSPVDEPGDNFWSQKAMQTGMGAIVGGAAVPVVEAIAPVVPKIINSVVSWWGGRPVKASAINPNDVRKTVIAALREQGIDTNAVPVDVVNSLTDQARQAMQAGRPLNKEAAARAADFATLGITPTKGQVSRDPAQFAFEQNVAGVKDIGDDIAARLGSQNRQLIGSFDRMPGAQGDRYATGQGIIDALGEQDKQMTAAVRGAYDAARNTVGAGAEVPLQPLAQRAGDVVETYGTENIPGAVMTKLKGYGLFGEKQTKSFTVEEADRLRKVINANYDPSKRAEAAALSDLLRGIDDSVNLMAERGAAIGPDAANAFAAARDTAKQRFQLLEKVPALKAVADGGAVPDKFFEKYVLRANVGEVEALKDLLKARPDVVGDVRGQVIRHLSDAATGGKPADMAQFSVAGYRKALADIGDRKLAMLFSPSEIAQLKAIERVAMARSIPPTGSPVNYSKSGSAVLDFANRMGLLNQVPIVGGVIRGAADSARRGMASQAANPSISEVISSRVPNYIDDATIDAIRRRLGLVSGGLLGIGVAGAANK